MARFLYVSLFIIGILGFNSLSYAEVLGQNCSLTVKCVCESENHIRVVSCPDEFDDVAFDCTNEGIDEDTLNTCNVDCALESEAYCEEIPFECKNNEQKNCLVTLPVKVTPICQSFETICSGQCVNLNSDETNCGSCGSTCASGLECIVGVCQCPLLLPTNCSGICTHLDTDPENCGTCDNSCASGDGCIDGECQSLACAPGFADCSGDGECDTIISEDEINCGECGNSCAPFESCVGGECM